MNSSRIVQLFLLLGALVGGILAAKAEPAARTRTKLNSQWSFQQGDPAGAEQAGFDDRSWKTVELPHDWAVDQPISEANPRYNGFYPRGIGWYRRRLELDSSFVGRQVYLEFEGAYRNSTLWVDGQKVGSHRSGYTGVVYDLNEVAHEEDSSRPTAFACEDNADANANGFALVTDIMGYNGGGMGMDDRDHKLYPQRKMLVSEFSSGRGARGVYKEKILARITTEKLGDGRTVTNAGQYFSTYDLCRSHEAEWSHIAQRPWLAGGAMWSGIDYAGETCGWPMVTSQFGVLDRCRFPNDAYYYYLQEWTTNLMVHLFPHWTWPGEEGQDIEVWCYSNCEAVELFLDGKSLGAKPCRPLTHLAWKVPYQPGTLSARALKEGKVACTDEVKTAGAPAQIQLLADRNAITSDGYDLSLITIRILDDRGIVVPVASNEVAVSIAGPGQLLGLCSGDPASHENPKAGRMKAFNGLLLAIVQSNGRWGDIAVRASSPGLASEPIPIKALPKPRER